MVGPLSVNEWPTLSSSTPDRMSIPSEAFGGNHMIQGSGQPSQQRMGSQWKSLPDARLVHTVYPSGPPMHHPANLPLPPGLRYPSFLRPPAMYTMHQPLITAHTPALYDDGRSMYPATNGNNHQYMAPSPLPSAPRPPPGLGPPHMHHQPANAAGPCSSSSTARGVSPAPTSSHSALDSRSASTATSPPTKHGHVGDAEEKDGSMDKYATLYIPSWLREVNEDPQFNLVPLPEEPNYDYDAFVSCFLPRTLVFSDPDEGVESEKAEEEGLQRVGETMESEEVDLVQVAPSWLVGDSTRLQGELEPNPLDRDQGDERQRPPRPPSRQQSLHVSVGAHSQAQPGSQLATTSVSLKIPDLPPSDAPLPAFHPDTYADRFTRLLETEYEHRHQMLAAQSLFDVQLSGYPDKGSSTAPWSNEHLYSFNLPGVREDYPNLVTGDMLQLRVLATHSNSWLRLALEAKVYVVHKVAGVVIIKCDALSTQLKTLFTSIQDARFNILFTSSALRGSTEVFSGIERVGKHLSKRQTRPGQVLKSWLFPSPGEDVGGCDQTHSNIQWYDDKLNAEQKGVVRDITLTRQRRIPFLIHGPPGTGKTKTLVEATLQILQCQPQSRILLTAPSVTAADTLALRLARHLDARDMTRINDPRRTFEEVPEPLLIFCTIEEGSSGGGSRFGLPDWDRFIKTRVVIMATQDIHILHLSKVSNLELGRWQGITLSAMLDKQLGQSAKLHWTHLLVDEAGQSSEAEMANALLLVVPSRFHDTAKERPTVVLCGDVAQLGPQIDSHYTRSHGLDVSLLERLSKRTVYRQQLSELRLEARKSLLRGDYGADRRGDDITERAPGRCAAHLVRNYRARNPSLLHVVSMLFYDDCLLPSAPLSLLDTSRWSFPNPSVPLLFDHLDAKDEWVDEGASFYNGEEINRVVELCQSMTKTNFVSAREIAVITPYREQVWRIRIKLRKVGLSAVSVGNVEVYQGSEHKVTVLSTVRSSRRFLEMDAKRSLGLVFERKRLCVALSRAQEALVVVGNANLLRLDPYWRSFIAYAKRNHTFRGNESGNEDGDGGQVGALEYAARVRSRPSRDSPTDRETDTAFLAGRMAASALYEEEEGEGEEEGGGRVQRM